MNVLDICHKIAMKLKMSDIPPISRIAHKNQVLILHSMKKQN